MSKPLFINGKQFVFRRHGIFRLKTSHIYQDTTTNGFVFRKTFERHSNPGYGWGGLTI